MGDSTDKSRNAVLTAQTGLTSATKPIQKVHGTVVVNKENAAPNSVQSTSVRPATRGLAARSTESGHGLSSGLGSTSTTASKRSESHQSLSSHARIATDATSKSTSHVPSSASKSASSAAAKDSSALAEVPALSASEVQAKADAVYNHLTTKEPFKGDIGKWYEYLRPYCEKRSYGFDVLRGILDFSLQSAKSELLSNPHYFKLWHFWASRLPSDDQYEAFKMIENNGIGTRCASLYVTLANLKLDQKDPQGALKVLENGLSRSAEPREDLEAIAEPLRRTYHTGDLKSAAVSIVSHGPQSHSFIPPSTPQHNVHMDCDSTPSGHAPASAGGARVHFASSTPSTRTIESASTPSPFGDSAAVNASSNVSGSLSTMVNGAGAQVTKRRAAALPARLGLRGGAQRVPKASAAVSAAASPAPSTMGMSDSAMRTDDPTTDKSVALAPIDEDSSVMQVDEPAHGPYTAGKSTGPVTGSTATTQPVTAGYSTNVSSSTMSSTSSSSLSTTVPTAITLVPTGPSSATVQQLASALPGRSALSIQSSPNLFSGSAMPLSATKTEQTAPRLNAENCAPSAAASPSQESLPTTTPVLSTFNPSESRTPGAPTCTQRSTSTQPTPPTQQAAAVAPSTSSPSALYAAPAPSKPQLQAAAMQPARQAVPSLAPAQSHVNLYAATKQQSAATQHAAADPQAAIDAANAAATALGRELFIIRGRPYINLAAIGKGGTCSVYKVMDMSGNIYALKVITWTNDTLEVINGYNQEVRLLESVQKSPFVVKLIEYELVATSNTMFILFEFAETDLRRLFMPLKMDPALAQVHPGGRFATDLDALRYYWRSMLSAVLVLHKARIVHLDLKPANFVLVEGRVKIIDFGIAKKVLNDTMHAKVEDIAGTILYMAPESLRNTSGRGNPHKVGFSADVWSMGCILYQMVFGFTPFEHVQGLMAKIAAITADEPIDVQPVDNEDLMDCLRICLDKNHRNRPTIEDLLNHPFLGGFVQWAPQ